MTVSNPRLKKHLPRQSELRIKVLLQGSIIDDGDRSHFARAALVPPLLLKHREDVFFEVLDHPARSLINRIGTAGLLGSRENGVEESAAGIGIHLDQLWAIVIEMKIIAHQGAGRTVVLLRDVRRPRQHGVAVLVRLLACEGSA